MHKRQRLYLLLLPLLLGLASCVTTRRVNYMQEPDKTIPSYADTLSYEDYEIRIGDRLQIYVYSLDPKITQMYNAGGNSANLRQNYAQYTNQYGGSYDLYTYLVDDEGYIEYPTIGKVYVKGMTTRQVKHEMERQLGTLLKEMPGYSTISVEANIVQRTYYLIGAQTGRYNIRKEKMTIFEAIAQAGDISEYGDRARVKLVREKNGETVIKTFDIRSKDIINSEFYYIEPNDIIYIRRFDGYSYGINNITAGFGVVTTTISFGVFIYGIVQMGISLAKPQTSAAK